MNQQPQGDFTRLPSPGTEDWIGDVRRIQDSLSVTRYVLPRRNLGKMRRVGWAPLGMGVFATLFMVFWMWGPISGGLHSDGIGRWLGIGFGLLGLPGLAIGIGLLSLGVVILTNASHAEITIGDGMLCAIERIGALPIRRRRRIEQVKRLVVEKGGIAVTDNRGMRHTLVPDLAALKAEMHAGKTLILAPGYPCELLRPLADKIANALPAAAQPEGVETVAPVVEVVEREADEPAGDVEVSRPALTDITLRTEANGLAISVPARGLWKGSQGLFFFSLLWNGFMVVFTAAMLKGKAPVPVYLFMLLFWGIGLGLLAGAIQMAKRRVLLAVVNGALAYRVTSPFRTSEKRFALADIETIRVGPSGMEVNNRPVMELQILPRDGKKVGLLSNRSREEQEWLAWVLRQQLAGR